MALARLRGRPAIDTARLPVVSTATKIVASFVTMLFSMCAFILPNAVGKLVAAGLAVGFACVAVLRPSTAKVGIRVLSFVAAAITVVAVVVAIADATGAQGTASTQVQP